MKVYLTTLILLLTSFTLVAQQDTVPGWTGTETYYMEQEVLLTDSFTVLCDTANATATDTTCWIGRFLDGDSVLVTDYSNDKIMGAVTLKLRSGTKIQSIWVTSSAQAVIRHQFWKWSRVQ